MMKLATNKYVLMACAIILWTVVTYRAGYSSGSTDMGEQCQRQEAERVRAVLQKMDRKLKQQADNYELQVARAKTRAMAERSLREQLEESLDAIDSTDAPDCERIPDEWLRAVQEAWTQPVS